MFFTGVGCHREVSNKLSSFYSEADITMKSGICRINVNEAIYHYVSDTKKHLNKVFDSGSGRSIYLDGFDELVENPRPAIADWHDWEDILLDIILKQTFDQSVQTLVMMSMSRKIYDRFLQNYPKFKALSRRVVHCKPYSADEMSFLLQKKMKDNGYRIWDSVPENLTKQFQQIVKIGYKVSGQSAINTMATKILKNQERRLSKLPMDKISKQRLRNILKVDIPSLSIPVDRDNVIYL